jgi:hypothetical protein
LNLGRPGPQPQPRAMLDGAVATSVATNASSNGSSESGETRKLGISDAAGAIHGGCIALVPQRLLFLVRGDCRLSARSHVGVRDRSDAATGRCRPGYHGFALPIITSAGLLLPAPGCPSSLSTPTPRCRSLRASFAASVAQVAFRAPGPTDNHDDRAWTSWRQARRASGRPSRSATTARSSRQAESTVVPSPEHCRPGWRQISETHQGNMTRRDNAPSRSAPDRGAPAVAGRPRLPTAARRMRLR